MVVGAEAEVVSGDLVGRREQIEVIRQTGKSSWEQSERQVEMVRDHQSSKGAFRVIRQSGEQLG